MCRVHQLVSLVQDVPVVHVSLVVPASEVRTMHGKQPCHWNVSRVPREQVGGNTMITALLTPSGGLVHPKSVISLVESWLHQMPAASDPPFLLLTHCTHTCIA